MVHPSTEENMTPRTEKGFWSEFLSVALFAAIIVLPVRLFIAQPFIVNGASMDPTFDTGDYLIVDQLSYRLHTPSRGDVIIFRYPKNPSKFFIKRVIGLPGETIALEGSTVTIFNDQNPDGILLEEPYITHPGNDHFRLTLGDDEYFVLGDNRPSSSDSRVWGPLPRENIIGRAFTRLLPLEGVGLYPGDSEHY